MTDTLDTHEVEYRQRLQRALGGDIELRDLIGRGGFGAVYAAWDRKLERDVAGKALPHDLSPTRLVLQRFQLEAKCRSPSCVTRTSSPSTPWAKRWERRS